MPLNEQCLRTMSKLDEISMFMSDFKDIIREGGPIEKGATGLPQNGGAGNNHLISHSTEKEMPNSKFEPATSRSGNTKLSY
jgi:hypothetical protein